MLLGVQRSATAEICDNKNMLLAIVMEAVGTPEDLVSPHEKAAVQSLLKRAMP